MNKSVRSIEIKEKILKKLKNRRTVKVVVPSQIGVAGIANEYCGLAHDGGVQLFASAQACNSSIRSGEKLDVPQARIFPEVRNCCIVSIKSSTLGNCKLKKLTLNEKSRIDNSVIVW